MINNILRCQTGKLDNEQSNTKIFRQLLHRDNGPAMSAYILFKGISLEHC